MPHSTWAGRCRRSPPAWEDLGRDQAVREYRRADSGVGRDGWPGARTGRPALNPPVEARDRPATARSSATRSPGCPSDPHADQPGAMVPGTPASKVSLGSVPAAGVSRASRDSTVQAGSAERTGRHGCNGSAGSSGASQGRRAAARADRVYPSGARGPGMWAIHRAGDSRPASERYDWCVAGTRYQWHARPCVGHRPGDEPREIHAPTGPRSATMTG